MPRSIAIRASSPLQSAGKRLTPDVSRLAHEGMTLAIGCAAAVVLSLALYLVAPAQLRDGVVAAFLGFDQPTSAVPAHPPMRL
jgi:hypothetical protein